MIAGATDLPVNGDLENGFGHDPESVAETIRGAAAAGLVGCSIEDSTSSRASRSTARPGRRARRGRGRGGSGSPFTFTLTARAENYLHGRSDLDDTIERLQAFDKAGADVLYAPGLRDIEDIRTVCAAVSKPVNVLALAGGPSVELLSAAGVRRVSLGSGFFNTALGAFLRAARDVHEHGTFGCLDGAATSRDLLPFMEGSDPELAGWTRARVSPGRSGAGASAAGTRHARRRRACGSSALPDTGPRTSPRSAGRRRSRGRRRP